MTELFTTENAIALLALTALEVVLGIDNVVLLAVLCDKLPEKQRAIARRTGLLLAMVMRILLLLVIGWVMTLDGHELFTVLDHAVTGKDLVLVVGGLFLVGKATHEIHASMEGDHEKTEGRVKATFWAVIAQVVLMDAVFSLDSVITAVGMVDEIAIMITAVVIAIAVMIAFAGQISAFISKHPTTKMLALAFLMLVGVVLIADGLGQHVPRGYIYSAMAFSLFVEMLNLRSQAKRRKKREAAASH